MSEIKYKGINENIIKEVQKDFESCKYDCITFSREKTLESLEKNETLMGTILGNIKRIEMQQKEATEMYVICEMARLWLKHCKDMKEIVERLEELYKYNSEQADIYMGEVGAYMREKKEMYIDRANCYGVAIRTVKEVGGMNE